MNKHSGMNAARDHQQRNYQPQGVGRRFRDQQRHVDEHHADEPDSNAFRLISGGGWLRWTPLSLLACAAFAAVIISRQRDEQSTKVSSNDVPADVGIDQKLNAQVPLDIQLRDETGNTVTLHELIDDKPVILTLVYYECPMLCGMTMDGQVRSLSEMTLNAGQDYTALTVSFDPRENHTLAAAAKRTAIRRYNRAGAERRWHFLTGDEPEIQRLTEAVGFRYKWDERRAQFAHAAGLVVLTPEGRISRYLYGVEFPPRDLRLALVEASDGNIGSATDQFLLLCYHYDPTTGKYGLAIMNSLRLAGLLTVVGLGTAVVIMIRRDRPNVRQASSLSQN